MLQMDGSHHDWLEGRGPEIVLMGCIDDATNKIFGRFYEYEGTIPAMDCFKHYTGLYGLPISVYLDRHTTYKSNAKPTIEDDLLGRKPMSQFERAMEELGVKVIHANSPQAKGRIERLFRTLQDRLVKEMRLKGIKTIREANLFLEGYLKRHNERFSIEAAEKEDLHRLTAEGFDLNGVLCVKTKRALRNDFTVAHNKKLYQILEPANTKDVIVEERISGSMYITHNNKALGFKEIYSSQEPPLEEVSCITKTGHFYFGKNRTFLNWLYSGLNRGLDKAKRNMIYLLLQIFYKEGQLCQRGLINQAMSGEKGHTVSLQGWLHPAAGALYRESRP